MIVQLLLPTGLRLKVCAYVWLHHLPLPLFLVDLEISVHTITVYCLVVVTLKQTKDTWGEGVSIEKWPPWEWLVGESMGH